MLNEGNFTKHCENTSSSLKDHFLEACIRDYDTMGAENATNVMLSVLIFYCQGIYNVDECSLPGFFDYCRPTVEPEDGFYWWIIIIIVVVLIIIIVIVVICICKIKKKNHMVDNRVNETAFGNYPLSNKGIFSHHEFEYETSFNEEGADDFRLLGRRRSLESTDLPFFESPVMFLGAPPDRVQFRDYTKSPHRGASPMSIDISVAPTPEPEQTNNITGTSTSTRQTFKTFEQRPRTNSLGINSTPTDVSHLPAVPNTHVNRSIPQTVLGKRVVMPPHTKTDHPPPKILSKEDNLSAGSNETKHRKLSLPTRPNLPKMLPMEESLSAGSNETKPRKLSLPTRPKLTANLLSSQTENNSLGFPKGTGKNKTRGLSSPTATHPNNTLASPIGTDKDKMPGFILPQAGHNNASYSQYASVNECITQPMDQSTPVNESILGPTHPKRKNQVTNSLSLGSSGTAKNDHFDSSIELSRRLSLPTSPDIATGDTALAKSNLSYMSRKQSLPSHQANKSNHSQNMSDATHQNSTTLTSFGINKNKTRADKNDPDISPDVKRGVEDTSIKPMMPAHSANKLGSPFSTQKGAAGQKDTMVENSKVGTNESFQSERYHSIPTQEQIPGLNRSMGQMNVNPSLQGHPAPRFVNMAPEAPTPKPQFAADAPHSLRSGAMAASSPWKKTGKKSSQSPSTITSRILGRSQNNNQTSKTTADSSDEQ